MKISKAKQQQIQKLEKSARAKSRRISKKYNYNLPVPTKSDISTTKELNAYVKKLKEYTNRNYMKFVNIGQIYAPQEKVKELLKANEEYVRKREEFYSKIKDKPFVTASGETETTIDKYAKTAAVTTKNKYFQFLNPQTIDLDTYTDISQIEKKLERLQRQSTDEYWEEKTDRFKENFKNSLTIIQENTGLYTMDIFEEIDDMTSEEFLNMYYRTDELTSVFNWTDPESLMIEAQPKLDRIRTLIDYFKGAR